MRLSRRPNHGGPLHSVLKTELSLESDRNSRRLMIRGLTSADEFGGSVEDGQWGKTGIIRTCQQAVTLGLKRDDEVDPGLQLWPGRREDGTVKRYLRIVISST